MKNVPLTSEQVETLPIGIHLHKFPNRKNRRLSEQNPKPGNNRKKTKCRKRYMGMQFKNGKQITLDMISKELSKKLQTVPIKL